MCLLVYTFSYTIPENVSTPCIPLATLYLRMCLLRVYLYLHYTPECVYSVFTFTYTIPENVSTPCIPLPTLYLRMCLLRVYLYLHYT